MKYLSVCIPTYEMNGKGELFLRRSFDILAKQSFKDFDIVISDHSHDDGIEKLCAEYSKTFDIHYYRNTERRGNSPANLNNSIAHADGKLIKVLFQDDFLYSPSSLQETVDAFDIENDHWLVSASEHTKDGTTFIRPFYPRYTNTIYTGKNTISSPSVLTIKNDHPLLFDEDLLWRMDVDYYQRCYEQFGLPKILNTITVVNYIGDHQISSQVPEAINPTITKREHIRNFFLNKKTGPVRLPTVTLVAVSSIKIKETVQALQYSMRNMKYAEVLLISDQKPADLDPRITLKECPPLRSIDEYSKFMLYDLASYINTEHALIVQYDGYVLRPHQWTDYFLRYDYIGAPWEKGAHYTPEGKNIRIGNGGFSLRSKKLLESFNTLNLPFTDNGSGFYNEDGNICNYHRKALEEYGIRFAPVEIASLFSCEVVCPDSYSKPFGFHKNQHLIPFIRRIKNYFNK